MTALDGNGGSLSGGQRQNLEIVSSSETLLSSLNLFSERVSSLLVVLRPDSDLSSFVTRTNIYGVRCLQEILFIRD